MWLTNICPLCHGWWWRQACNFFASTLFGERGKGGLSEPPPYLPAATASGSAERVARGRLYGGQGFMATNAQL